MSGERPAARSGLLGNAREVAAAFWERLRHNLPQKLSALALATVFWLFVTTDDAFVAATRAHNARWRRWFADEVAAMGNAGLRAVPSQANFVLVLFEGRLTAEAAYQGLMDEGYIVRWLPGQGLPHGLRITIGTAEETQGVAAALRALVER